MSFCPACRSEYRAGFSQCADCGGTLVEQLPPSPARLSQERVTEVAVATYPNWLQASIGEERLKAAGIPAFLKATGAGRGQPGTEQLWPHALYVRAQDVKRVREMLGDAVGAPIESSEAWPEQDDGGEASERQAPTLWRLLAVVVLLVIVLGLVAARACAPPVVWAVPNDSTQTTTTYSASVSHPEGARQ